jgi:hypothetical protein
VTVRSIASAALVLSLACPAAAQPLPRRVPAELAPLADGCRGGDLRACYDLGVRYQTGEGVRRNFRTAAALFEHACSGGDTYGCNGLGRLHENGHGVRRDAARALSLYRQACDGSDWPVCYYVGWLNANGRLTAVNLDEGRRYYRLACDHGYADACAALELPPIVAESELRDRFTRFVLDAGRAAVRSVRGQSHDARFDGDDASRDLRASDRLSPGGASPSELATIWLFEFSEHVADTRYARLQLMAFVFPDGRLRWSVSAEQRSGRPTRALVEGTLLDLAPPHLSRPFDATLSAMREGRCDAIELATEADVAALPAPIRNDVTTSRGRLRESCAIARRAANAELLPSSTFLSAVVRAGARTILVASDVEVTSAGRVWLSRATTSEL